MVKKSRILIVDDHPMIVRGYESLLRHLDAVTPVKLDCAYTLNDGMRWLEQAKPHSYDVVVLDISMPPSEEYNLLDGEDLGKVIRRKHPSTKLMVLTMLNDRLRINGILKRLNPEAFALKTEVDSKTMEEMFRAVTNGKRYLSKKVLKSTHKKQRYFSLDEFDRRILYHIAAGEKTKNLTKHIPFSLPTIERRKRNIKIALGIPGGDDRELIATAQKKGFL